MAFNPFHGFRKHQKTMFAGLTILCMVIFVLQFGPGDLFSRMTDRIGGRRVQDKDRAGALYGEPVSADEVAEVQRSRTIANQYMMTTIQIAHQNIIRKVDADLLSQLKPDDPARQDIQGVIQQWMGAYNTPEQFAQFRGYFMQMYQQGLRQNAERLDRLRATYDAAKKTLEASLVMQLEEMLLQDEKLLRRPNELYFGGGSTKNVRDLLDFKIWLHQADRLGVQLTRDDVGRLINQEALRQLTNESMRLVDRVFFSQYRNLSRDALASALSDEFRVRLAKAALLGYDIRPESGVPPAITPYEYWTYFRQNRTENIVEILPVPVRNQDFLSKVGNPTEEELAALYGRFKELEPALDSPNPGFKEPPRVEMEWVSARPDSEYYQTLAKQQLQISQDVFQVTAGGTLPLGSIASAVAVTVPSAFDLQLIARYDQEKYRFRSPSWTDAWNMTLHDTSRNRAENAASLIGQVAAAAGTGFPLAAAPAAFESPAFAREARDRARIWTTLFLTAAGESPVTAAGMAYAMTPRSEYLPLEQVRGTIAEELQKSAARDLAVKNLTAVRDELERLARERPDALRKAENAGQPTAVASAIGGAVSALATGSALSAPVTYGALVLARDIKQADQLAGASIMAGASGNPWTAAGFAYRQQALPERRAREYLDRAIAQYHLRHGTTSRPRNRFNIAEDEGLQPLKQAFERSRSLNQKLKNFAQVFFPVGRAYDPQRWPRADTSSMDARMQQFQQQMDDHVWSRDEEPLLFWKTGDLPAYVPTFAEAKPKVEEAWRLDKARKLAQEEAERVAAEARKAQGDADRVLKDGSSHSGKAFTLDRVARLTKPVFPVQSREMGNVYQIYKIPEEKVEYPTGDFLESLLQLKDRGDVVVLHDRPRTTYYVATLVFRASPDEKSFYEDYSKHASSLLAQVDQETHSRDKFRDAVTMRLETEAGLNIDEDFRRKFESQRGSDEE